VVSVTPRSRFTPGERTPGTHCTGGWVGLRAGLDTEAREKILCLCRGSNNGRPVLCQDNIPTEVPQLPRKFGEDYKFWRSSLCWLSCSHVLVTFSLSCFQLFITLTSLLSNTVTNELLYSHNQSKVKQSRYTPRWRLGREEVYLLLILDLGTRWGWVVSFTPRPRFAPGKGPPGTRCTGGWVGPRAGLDTEVRGKRSK
jgi:hypothetical protein